jgi:hypothetical protein
MDKQKIIDEAIVTKKIRTLCYEYKNAIFWKRQMFGM